MRRPILLFSLTMMIQCISAQNLDSQLTQLYKKDQQAQLKSNELFLKVKTDGFTQQIIDSLFILEAQTKRLDSTNLQTIERILQKGWPKGLKSSSYNTIFLIIDDAPVEKQKQYLPLLRKAAQEGDIMPADLATLSDRIDLRE